MWLYVLRCDCDKFYIGKTNRHVNSRIYEHFKNKGSLWTRIYKPIDVVETFKISSNMFEDIHTKLYMKQYGIDNVRGGSYSTLYLPTYKIRALEDEFRTMDELCYTCGESDHFTDKCPYKLHYYIKRTYYFIYDIIDFIINLYYVMKFSYEYFYNNYNKCYCVTNSHN